MSEENGKIRLFVKNKTAVIWSSDDWMLMRKNRVVGHFVGNLAALPRQDISVGLPLALLPEEATLLMEKNLATFLEVPSLSEIPSDHIRDESRSFRSNTLAEQVSLLKELRKKEIEKNIGLIVKGKMMKMKGSADSEATETEIDMDSLQKRILQEEFDKIQSPKTSNLSIQIFTDDPWIKSDERVHSNWTYPETEEDKLHYLTYKDLWERGYYITSGKKFGADYLAYPGDPVLFHSFFIVVCTDRTRQLKANQIITYGRLGQSVRKTFVLAYLTDGNEVNYQSIQWIGH